MFDLYDPETGEFNRAQLEAWIRNPPALKPMYPTEDAATAAACRTSASRRTRSTSWSTTCPRSAPRPPSPDGPEPTAPTTDEGGS